MNNSLTLVFGPEDSGTDQYSITYQAVPGEKPVLTSGVEIEGWKKPEAMLGDLPVPAEGKRAGPWRLKRRALEYGSNLDPL
jgi:hypothetical protein